MTDFFFWKAIEYTVPSIFLNICLHKPRKRLSCHFYTKVFACLGPAEIASTKRLINDYLWLPLRTTGCEDRRGFRVRSVISQGFHRDLTWENEVTKPERHRVKGGKKGGRPGKGFYLRTQKQSTHVLVTVSSFDLCALTVTYLQSQGCPCLLPLP